ncbi:beta-lactamase/transpeptidase-like protein [Trichoderma pleuroticola]
MEAQYLQLDKSSSQSCLPFNAFGFLKHACRHAEPRVMGSTHSSAFMKCRLQRRFSTWREIQNVTHQPGISIGIIYNGDEILKHNMGVMDVATKREPNSDTLYCIASLSKAFMAESIELLISDGHITWDTTIQSVIPEFKHREDPQQFSKMTLRDICSHRTGLIGLDEITQGLNGRILIPKKDVVKVCSAMPIKHAFRTKFHYNNGMYELAGCVVERLSRLPTWGHFQNDRIFTPLQMTRTTAFRSIHATDNNIAKSYIILENGEPQYIPPTELSADSMNGGSGGIRSSVNDLLKWCSYQLNKSAEKPKQSDRDGAHTSVFNRAIIADSQSPLDGDYCTGWCYHQTPAKLGLISPNRALESPVVGLKSPSLVIYSHQGDVPGYTCNLYIIPDAQAAIVVLSNGTGLGDATDWIAQDILQTIFKLKPKVDMIEAARKAATNYRDYYHKNFEEPLERHRQIDLKPVPLNEFVGTYSMKNLDTVTLRMTATKKSERLQMIVNDQADQVWEMKYYADDTFCHLPDTYNECLAKGINRTKWNTFLITFNRDEKGKIINCSWRLDDIDVIFNRV